MTLLLTDEQEALRGAVRNVIARKCPMERVRAFVDCGGSDRPQDLWTTMANQMELAGLAIPVKYGGTESGLREVAVVMEELGRSLAVSPFFPSAVLAGQALIALADQSALEEFLPGIADGSLTFTYAWIDPQCDPETVLRSSPSGLTGSVPFVLEGFSADYLIVEALGVDNELSFHLVSATASGNTQTELVSADPTRSFSRIVFDGTSSRQLTAMDPRSVHDRIIDRAALALAAEQLGAMARCVELTVEYAKVRAQFGQTIGSYQSVKHRLADMYSVVELARALVRDACRAGDDATSEFPLAARSAFAYCSRHCPHVVSEMIQLHGGIAYTWEHDAHFYYKRAHACGQILGGPERHEGVVASLLGF